MEASITVECASGEGAGSKIRKRWNQERRKSLENDVATSQGESCWFVSVRIRGFGFHWKWWEDVKEAKSFPLDTMLNHQLEVRGGRRPSATCSTLCSAIIIFPLKSARRDGDSVNCY